MHIIHPAQLDLVTGGAAPSPAARPPMGGPGGGGGANNLGDWLPKDPSQIKPADNRAFTNPPSPNFKTNTPMVNSPSDRSWQQGLDKAFSHFGL